MQICVLLSCMHQKDISIVERSNIQTDAVIVNQCDQDKIEKFSFINKKGKECHVKFIYTTERGLSKSRNMAIRNCEADVCLLADDDECFSDDYEDIVLSAYKKRPDAGVIAFSLIRKDLKKGKFYPREEKKLGFKQIFSTTSVQLSFKRSNNIYFDEKMGSGTGNGGGEENKFLFDVRRKKIAMWYNPSIIATINPGESTWFKGYNENFFKNHGWASRRSLGVCLSLLYCCYYVVKMRKRTNLHFLTLVTCEFHGWLTKK